MLDVVRNKKWLAQAILALLIVPFAFFGMDAYFADAPGGGEVASVAGTPIYESELERALREQQDAVRQRAGGQVDSAVLESALFRRSVLEDLINRRVVALAVAEKRLVVAAPALQAAIRDIEAFSENGQFSMARYEALLAARGMNPQMFEAQMATDLRNQQLGTAIAQSAIVASASVRQLLAAELETRSVRALRFPVADYLEAVTLAPEAARAYYDANPERFARPARLKAQYAVLRADDLAAGIHIDDAEIVAAYEANPSRYGVPEERRARHILLELAPDADEATVAQVMAHADALRTRLLDGADFAELAATESQDPGSSGRGGDLGFFSNGVMVPAFEEAAFALDKGVVSEPVRSEFGVHLIEVTEIRPADVRPLDEVRDELATELRQSQAGIRYGEAAERFANLAYEQPDSLEPLVDAFGLTLQTSDWVSATDAGIGGFDKPEVVAALFSADARELGNNINAVEVAPATMLSARVIDFEPATTQSFEAVEDAILAQLRLEEAARLARAAGDAVVAGDQSADWPALPTELTRNSNAYASATIETIFAQSDAALPVRFGVAEPDAYVVFRLDSVTRPELAADDPRLNGARRQYAELLGQQDLAAYLESLRTYFDVKINETILNRNAV